MLEPLCGDQSRRKGPPRFPRLQDTTTPFRLFVSETN